MNRSSETSSRGNPVKQTRLTFIRGMGTRKRTQFVEQTANGQRLYNPKRDIRHVAEKKFGVKTGRQWVRLRRALRAAGQIV